MSSFSAGQANWGHLCPKEPFSKILTNGTKGEIYPKRNKTEKVLWSEGTKRNKYRVKGVNVEFAPVTVVNRRCEAASEFMSVSETDKSLIWQAEKKQIQGEGGSDELSPQPLLTAVAKRQANLWAWAKRTNLWFDRRERNKYRVKHLACVEQDKQFLKVKKPAIFAGN